MAERLRGRTTRAISRSRLGALLALTLVAATISGCKPEKPDVVAAARAEATQRAEEARKTAAGEGAMGRLGTPGGGLTPETAATVVARIGESTITLGDMGEFLARQSRLDRARYTSPDARRALLEDMVRMEVLAREGARQGLDQSPTVRMAFKKALAEALLDHETGGALSVGAISEAEVVKRYTDHRDEYARPETREAVLLMLDDEASAREAHAAISAALARSPAEALTLIQSMAAERSIDPRSRAARGDLGAFDRAGKNLEGQQRVAPELVEQAFAVTAAPALAPPVHLENLAWSVLLVTRTQSAGSASLDDVRVQIQGELLAERREKARQELVDALRRDAEVSIDAKALEALGAPATPKKQGGAVQFDAKALRRGLVREAVPGVIEDGGGGEVRHLSPDEVQRKMQQQRERQKSAGESEGAQ
ncbi:MAG: peptidylprolyl isomerase [Myxococcota bacterium]